MGCVAALAACGPEASPRPECPPLVGGTAAHPLLLGARAWRSGGVVRLDRGASPAVALAPAATTSGELRWAWSGPSGVEPMAARWAGEGDAQRVHTATTPRGRPDRLELRAGPRVCGAWAVEWADPDAEAPLRATIEAAREAERAAGEDAAEQGWRAVAEAARAADLPSTEARALRAAAFMAVRARRFTAAARLVEDARRAQAPLGEGPWSAHLAYTEGLLQQARGELAGAEQRLDRAIALGTRYGLTDELPSFREARALALLGQSRFEDALAVLATTSTACRACAPADRARARVNEAWIHLRAQGTPAAASLETIDGWLGEALDMLGGEAMPALRANVFHKRALVARARGDRAEAERWVAAYRAVPESAGKYVRPAVDLLDAELALDAGDRARADAAFVALEARARSEQAVASDVLWRAIEGRARVARADGRRADAVRLYREALEALDETARLVGVLGPRAHFLADRGGVVRDALDVFAAAGALSEIVQAVEDDRRRLIDSLIAPAPSDGARQEWDEAIEALEARRRAHDALLVRERTATRAELPEVRAARQVAQSAAERALGDALALVDRERARTPRLSVAQIQRSLRPGEALRLVWQGGCGAPRCAHALWVERAGLRLDVEPARWPARVYEVRLDEGTGPPRPVLRLSLPSQVVRRATATATAAGRMIALVDPDGSLPRARAEGDTLAALFPALELRVGRDITRAVALDALATARRLHYGGHVDVHPRSPWDAELRLADGDAVRLADLLAARPSPELLVLGSCNGARPIRLASGRTLSLAELFLVAGARVVVAARGEVGDADAQAVVERFYREGGAHAPAEALDRTRRALAREGPPDRAAAAGAFEIWGVP